MDSLTAILYTEDSELNSNIKEDKQKFYMYMKDLGFDFSDIDEETRLPKTLLSVLANDINAVLKFNMALTTLHKEKKTNIIDAANYLVTDYIDESELLKILQTNVLGMLQSELTTKYNLFSLKQNKVMKKFIK